MGSHFAVFFRGDSFTSSLTRHQHRLFAQLDLKPGMRVLNVGCGTGEAAFELANFDNVFVVGVDSDLAKIEKATTMSIEKGLSDRVTFVLAAPAWTNLRNIFDRHSFDGIYALESLKSASSFSDIYQNFSYLLRIGGKLAIYEWCWTQSIDPTNIEHCRLAELVESATGICHRSVTNRSFAAALQALQSTNFSVVFSQDLATTSASIPWYTYLDSALHNSRLCWSNSTGEDGVFGGLTRNAASILSEAGHLQLFTPMAMLVAKRIAPPRISV